MKRPINLLSFTLLLFFISIRLNAQNTYKNNINEVKTLNIYGSNDNVLIGKIIINQTLEPPPIKILQSQQFQKKDGTWVTGFAFGHNSPSPLYNVNLKITFDKPVDSLQSLGISYFMGPNNTNKLSLDKLSYSFQASELHASVKNVAAFVIRIVSKDKINATVTGVDADH